MNVMHHDTLRVNAEAPESDEVFDIYAERGWVRGPHVDSDPNDLNRDLPRVLPAPEPAAAKAKANPPKD